MLWLYRLTAYICAVNIAQCHVCYIQSSVLCTSSSIGGEWCISINLVVLLLGLFALTFCRLYLDVLQLNTVGWSDHKWGSSSAAAGWIHSASSQLLEAMDFSLPTAASVSRAYRTCISTFKDSCEFSHSRASISVNFFAKPYQIW